MATIHISLEVIPLPATEDGPEYDIKMTWDHPPNLPAEERVPITFQKPPRISIPNYTWDFGCFCFEHGEEIFPEFRWIAHQRLESEDNSIDPDEWLTDLPFTITHRLPAKKVKEVKEGLSLNSGDEVVVRFTKRHIGTIWWQKIHKSDIKVPVYGWHYKEFCEEQFREEGRVVDFGLDTNLLEFDRSDAWGKISV